MLGGMESEATVSSSAAAGQGGSVPAPPVVVVRATWVRPVSTLLASVVLLVLFISFFDALSVVMLGVLAAAVIAATLEPLLKYCPGPRALAAAIEGLGLLAIVGGLLLALSWPLAKPLEQFTRDWPNRRAAANEALAKWSGIVGLNQPMTVEEMLQGVGTFMAGAGGQKLFSQSADVLLGFLISLALVLFGSIFLLAEPASVLTAPAIRLLPPRHQPTMRHVFAELAPRYRRWVIGTLTGMFVVFSASMLGYTVTGIEMALPLAMLAGLAEIVPTVGPATAGVIAALFVAATQGGGKALAMVIVYAIIQALEAYLILPMIMRGAVKIHPAVTLFTVVLWGKIFGLPGLILAIPINLTIWTLVDHFHLRRRRWEEDLPRILEGHEEEKDTKILA